MKIPNECKSPLISAESLFNDAMNLPPALKYDASRIFLLITSWELLATTNNVLQSFIRKTGLDPKTYSDHAFKLTTAPSITNVAITSSKAITKTYNGRNMKELRMLCLYGDAVNYVSRGDFFSQGHWHYDSFVRKLKSKINLCLSYIEAIESLPDKT